MGKKNREALEAEYERFAAGCADNGYTPGAVKALWDVLVPFADYSFNKSHAVGYAVIAYRTAFLKANHPKEYMCAVLSREDDTDKLAAYLAESRRMGVAILPPSVNGAARWSVDEQGIRYGLESISGVGAKVVAGVRGGAPYTSLADYLRRAHKTALNIGALRALCDAGALDAFGSREGLQSVVAEHVAAAVAEREELARGERGFGLRTYRVPELPVDYPARSAAEKVALGVVLSAPPVVFTTPATLTRDGWSYIRAACAQNPGLSAVAFTHGPWTMTPRFSVDGEGLARALAPLGVTCG
jgi:DNA polymerase III alpha subunit